MRNTLSTLIIVLIISSCKNKVTVELPPVFEVCKPIVQSSFYIKEYVADIHSVRYVEVRPRVSGYVEKVFVDEGELVREGQVLFSIGSREYELQLQKANAALKIAIAESKTTEVELLNIQNLFQKNIVSLAELKMAEAKAEAQKAKVEEAEANKQQAALNLYFSQVRAPYMGKINRIPYKVGSLVQTGDVLTTISDNSEVFVYFNLTESDYLNYLNDSVSDWKTVKLILTNGQTYPLQGHIEVTESEFDQETGNIAFRARFKNPQLILKHGSNGKVVLKKKISNGIFIPQRSTFEIQDKLFVFTVDKDSVVHQKNIVSSKRIENLFLIDKGISKEENFVFEGIQKLRDGDKISPKLISKEEVLERSANL